MDLHPDDTNIRRRHAAKEGRFRPLISAPTEEELALASGEAAAHDGLIWFAPLDRQLESTMPDPDDDRRRAGLVLPVLTHVGAEADDLSRHDTCPSCLQPDGIRFLGSAIATLLSVTLSTVFGSPHLDAAEKKSLVFTDSVQDAAHRAGFIEARSHTLTFRAMLRDALDDEPCTLDELVQRVVTRAGDDVFRRYRMVPPDLVGRDDFDDWWRPERRSAAARARTKVQRRLLFDASLEFGLQSTLGRTLERVGSAVAEVDAGEPARLAAIGRSTFDVEGMEDRLDTPLRDTPDAAVVGWVRGVLERIRERGGISHDWLARYIARDGNRWQIWGGRPRTQGMPAFPTGRAAPAFPRIGGAAVKDPLLDPVTSAQGWYALWTARTLGVSPGHGARLAKALLERLAVNDVLVESATESGGKVYGIAPQSLRVFPVPPPGEGTGHAARVRRLQDPARRQPRRSSRRWPGCAARASAAPVTSAPRHGPRTSTATSMPRRTCDGSCPASTPASSRTPCGSGTRRSSEREPPTRTPPTSSSPHPTLEMGIDIGDLSTVVLASLPRTVASYLQRVGRAGRLTGNALNLAFVTGRGEHLPRIGDPLSVINGEVRPPATYLDAAEILQRQYIAAVVDRMARTLGQELPQRASTALGSAEEGSFLGDLVALAEDAASELLATFLGSFDSLRQEARDALTAWATPATGTQGGAARGTSDLAQQVFAASLRWQQLEDALSFRRKEIVDSIPGLQQAAQSPAATEDDRRDFRAARAALQLVDRQLRTHRAGFWVAALEEYGLLPNYTLMDDAVTLDVSVTWRDPDTNDWVSEPRSFNRAAALALRDFAPGATFYARGLEMEIDGLDIGSESDRIQTWLWCDCCGYADRLDPDAQPQTTCPRCDSATIADAAQRLDVVELTRVMSEVRRDEAKIGDTDDERKRTTFLIATAADLDPANLARQWTANAGTFGVAHYREMSIRWLNAGRRGTAGSTASVAGVSLPSSMFRVCAACGKADSHANRNSTNEHRPWCRHRTSHTETTRTVGLTRSLTTQSIVMSLPLQVTLGDSFAVPSLAAAVLLGLRERIGGQPDHLEVTTVPAPVPQGEAGETREALLLHDVVPGGTGYLTDLSTPEEVWDLLATALRVVADCPCRDEERLACHRCLLPFSQGLGPDKLSRLAAERHLRTILGIGVDAAVPAPGEVGWAVEDGPRGRGQPRVPPGAAVPQGAHRAARGDERHRHRTARADREHPAHHPGERPGLDPDPAAAHPREQTGLHPAQRRR